MDDSICSQNFVGVSSATTFFLIPPSCEYVWGRPRSSYRMSPLNRGSSQRDPISILRCHTGVLLGVIGVLHPSTAVCSVIVPLNTDSLCSGTTGSTATLVLPHGNRGLHTTGSTATLVLPHGNRGLGF